MLVILHRWLATGFYIAILGAVSTGNDALGEVPSALGGTAVGGGG